MKFPQSRNSRGLLLALPAAVASLSMLTPQSVQAADYTFNTTGGTGGTPSPWSTSSWSPGVPTSSLDNVFYFTAPSGQRMITTNNLGNGFQLNRLVLTNNTSNTNPQNLSIAGNSLNFVKNSADVLPSITIAKSNTTSTVSISAAMTVTDALTITNSATGGTTQFSGAINNIAGVTFDGSGSGALTWGGGITSGAGGITNNGAYTVVLTGNNTYTGVTTFGSGVISVGTIGDGGVASGNLGRASNAATNLVFNGGTLRYTGANATSDRAFTINAGKTATIETANNISFAGATGAATNGALTKIGAGTLTLDGANTYTGATTVSAGTLVLSAGGSISSSSVVLGTGAGGTGTFDISSKASYSQSDLSGNGTVNNGANVLTVTGNLAPGFSAGKLSVTGGLTLAGPSVSAMEISGTSRGVTGGYDAVDVGGSLIYGGTLALTLTGATVYDVGTTFSLFDASGFSGDFSSLNLSAASTPYAGLTFTETGSGASGVWTSTVVSGGAADGQYLVFDQGTGDLSVVPEPAASLLVGIGCAAFLWRRRSRG